MDALTIMWKSSPLYRFGISPNKLMDYMMAGKPIVQSLTAANDIVSDSGCGISVPSEDTNGLVSGIRRLLEMTPDERAEMGSRGRDYVVRHYEYCALASKWMDAFGPAF